MRDDRRFLFLQGPHGPFFDALGRLLRRSGATTLRVGFNAGDAAFWRPASRYVAFHGRPEDWPGRVAALIEAEAITDLVVYGDVRPLHAAAIAAARARGLTVHVFEEGYLRPWWVSYERGGANANSRLMRTDLAEMRAALAHNSAEQRNAPAHWGDMREHVFYGALYHLLVALGQRRYPAYRPHRGASVAQEFRGHLRHLLTRPFAAVERTLTTRRIVAGGFPYHLCLLQLEHDASLRAHSPFASNAAFLEKVVAGFAAGAPAHHHLVLKDHPLDDGRAAIGAAIRRLTARHGLDGRVHHLRGGKLARLMDEAKSAVTVNSTAAQQALWRGLPVLALGASVYTRPELVSAQDPAAFFADPMPPDAAAYRDFRQYLLETSQIPGGFYSARGRRQLLRRAADLMLAECDPYESLAARPARIDAPARPPLRLAS